MRSALAIAGMVVVILLVAGLMIAYMEKVLGRAFDSASGMAFVLAFVAWFPIGGSLIVGGVLAINALSGWANL